MTNPTEIALFVGNNIAGKTQAVSIASTYIHNNNVNYVIYLDSVGTNTCTLILPAVIFLLISSNLEKNAYAVNIANGTTVLENTDRNALVYAASSFDTVTVDVGFVANPARIYDSTCA